MTRHVNAPDEETLEALRERSRATVERRRRYEERYLGGPQPHRDVEPITIAASPTAVRDELVRLATVRTRELISRANDITPAHGELLDAMAELIMEAALGHLEGAGRLIVTAPVGMGKSSTVRAVAEVLHRFGPADAGLLILQPRIEEGAQTRDALIEQCRNVAPIAEYVGHVHSRGGLTTEQGKAKRFCLVTHARSRMPEIAHLINYNGRRRGVVIDEALRTSWANGVQVDALEGTLGWGIHRFARRSDLTELVAWLDGVRRALDDAMRALQSLPESGEGPRNLRFKLPPPPSPDLAQRWTWKLNQHERLSREAAKRGIADDLPDGAVLVESTELPSPLRKRSEYAQAAELQRLIEGSSLDAECRLVEARGREDKRPADRLSTLLQHRHIVPEALRDAIILDAGGEADEMTQLDDGARLAHRARRRDGSLFLSVSDPAKVKDWSQVSIDWIQTPAGRNSISKAARGEDTASAEVFRHAAQWLTTEKPREALVVTFLGDVFANRLRQELKAIGYRGEVDYVTWGKHDATNAYQTADAVILLGVLQLDSDLIKAMILGQKNKPESPVPTAEETTAAKRGHEATVIYQALGRGCARQQDKGGKAKAMRVLLFQEFPAVIDKLRALMPGVRITAKGDWRRGRKSGCGGAPRKADRIASLNAISDHLTKLAAEGVEWTTTAALKLACGFQGDPKAFQRALAEVLKSSPDWGRAAGNTHATRRASPVLLRKDTFGRTLEDRIRGYLAGKDRVSTVKLNEALKPPGMDRMVFNGVTQGAIEGTGWRREARTLVHTGRPSSE